MAIATREIKLAETPKNPVFGPKSGALAPADAINHGPAQLAP
jgi:hypothetical protein